MIIASPPTQNADPLTTTAATATTTRTMSLLLLTSHRRDHSLRLRLRRELPLRLISAAVFLIFVVFHWEDRNHGGVAGMVVRRAWTTRPWCARVASPRWPFAYEKFPGQGLEWKGRVNPSAQDLRHVCAVVGVASKCHRCEGTAMELQGVAWDDLPRNIPTVTDVPWAIGGRHRYDYGSSGATHLCQLLSGGDCLRMDAVDYRSCSVRCWGRQSGALGVAPHPERGNATSAAFRGDDEAADLWAYPADASGDGRPQGQVTTLAGSGVRGFADGPLRTAKFNAPEDVAVDARGVVYVADTANHRIRRVDPSSGLVTTLAGDGLEGTIDGPAATARFAFPTGVAVYDDPVTQAVVVLVADTGNHRIRQIRAGVVSCLAGLCGGGVESARLAAQPARPHPGLADGDGASARFDSPMGVAVDPAAGQVFVADTGNHLIRRIDLATGLTWTLAGRVEPSDDAATPGCVSPCLRGVPGFADGNLTFAAFRSPRDVAIGPQGTVVVADGHRIRRINYDGQTSHLESITSTNRVVTLAGSQRLGHADGRGDEATFHAPAGVTVAADGRVYVVSPMSCKLRQLSTATQVARAITCWTRASEIVLPSGCGSYEPPVDELFLRGTPVTNNVYYNYAQRQDGEPVDGPTLPGRRIKDCTGTPPIDALDTGNRSLARRDPGTGAVLPTLQEDQEDGTILTVRCPAQCRTQTPPVGMPHLGRVFGSTLYTDESSICLAAVHAGIVDDAHGGLVELTLERGIEAQWNATFRQGTTAHGVTSEPMPASPHASARLIRPGPYPLPTIEVATIAGHPSAQLASGCGYADAMPPQAARFAGPRGLEIYAQHALTRTQRLVIADTDNHRLRLVTATCAKICENGGACVGPDTCACPAGWSGDDCSVPQCTTVTCGARELCVGPDQCACIPGYTGSPACATAQCVQTCANGGACVAPDTCACTSGWFDANCTTPVCSQTCGNGGRCVGPDTCACPSEWSGADCRIPVCAKAPCRNGGACVAPDTCLCAEGWSGHDCGLPVCAQGAFVADPSPYDGATSRPRTVDVYAPCDWPRWCEATGELDCRYRLDQGASPVVPVAFGDATRAINGRLVDPRVDEPAASLVPSCLLLELGRTALAHYQYLDERNDTTAPFRFAPKTPYGWNAAGAAWRGILDATDGGPTTLPPFNHASDRQVALVERRRVVQGVYACANGGSCVAPGVCRCAPGWIGFDCRTPVCEQGYYVPTQPTFFAADPPSARDPRQPTANPPYDVTVETIAYDHVDVQVVTRGGVRYLPAQGGYACSIRGLTQWEKPGTLGPFASAAVTFEHPNYVSGYMDKVLQADGYYHTYWQGMSWPPLYELTAPLLDDTREGWRRGGTWQRRPGVTWQKGRCLVEFNRTCTRNAAQLQELVGGRRGPGLVPDTDAAFRSRVVLTAARSERRGDWNASVFGACVDEVVRGCYNNGTCIGPNTCRCAPGWSGPDCSVPLCTRRPCQHHGNCTLPDRCTCERGWTGDDCSVPMCAQDCRNGGRCVAPDTCECRQWPSTWRDGREGGGEPVFRTPEGQAQLTGYTGYDCNTPICVQAEAFVLNTNDSDGYVALRGHGKDGRLGCGGYRCPQYDAEVVGNDGRSFQSGCTQGNPLPNPRGVPNAARQLANLRAYNDSLNTKRQSDAALCGNVAWTQGDYLDGGGRHVRVNYRNVTRRPRMLAGDDVDADDEDVEWREGPAVPGEGVFMCQHRGTCLAPDTCSCGDGWTGMDCSVPQCRFLARDSAGRELVRGCLHDGVCVDKDRCRCIEVPSTLHERHPMAPRGLTGYTGADCAIPVCVQGTFDPSCRRELLANVSDELLLSATDGCYRCRNGGTCVAPDVCACAEGWTGFDCSEPICQLDPEAVKRNGTLRAQLFTVDEAKVEIFAADPCGTQGGRWGREPLNGAVAVGQGNCTQPGLCTCLCRKRYDPVACEATGEFCEKPWQDPFHRSIPPGFIYGTKDCVDGFQGLEDEHGRFRSCHLQIYVPSLYRRYTVSMVAILSVLSVVVLIAWSYIRKRIRRQLLLAKAERRRSRKNSEENPIKPKAGAFVHAKQA